MNLSRTARIALSALALIGMTASSALADSHRVYFSTSGEKRLPDCTASSVQGAVRNRIGRAIPSYYNGLRVLGLDNIQEARFEVNGVSPVARRFCSGTADLSDGSRQTINYLIEEHAGLFGIGWNVEACLGGRDKWHVYGAKCSTVRPR